MTTTLTQYGLDRLSPEEGIALAEALWESVDQNVENSPLTEPQRAELDRRVADSDARPDDVIPWEVVKADILASLQK